GLRPSKSRSAIRLKAIAVERAPTMAMAIQTICHVLGMPRAASTAPRNANGSANSVCSILIISSVVRMFVESEGIEDFKFQISNSDLKSQISNLRFKIQDSRFKIQDSRFKIQDAKPKTENCSQL